MAILKFEPPKERAFLRVKIARDVQERVERSRDAVNLQRRVVKRPIVLPSEIMNLPKLAGYLKLPGGYPVTKVTLHIRERKELAAIYISRRGEMVL